MPHKPLGKPLPKTPADYIPPLPTQDEVRVDIAHWNANCPPWAVGLLEAEPIENKGGKSKFVFDKTRNTYTVRRTGRVILRGDILKAFQEYQRKVGK